MKVKTDKPFAKMSSEELKKYLTELYTEKLKLLFDKTIELSK
jgi:ribosomal protein L29